MLQVHHADSLQLNYNSITENFFHGQLLLVGLCLDIRNCISCKASNGCNRVNTKVGRAWTEAVTASFKLLFLHGKLIQSPDRHRCPGS